MSRSIPTIAALVAARERALEPRRQPANRLVGYTVGISAALITLLVQILITPVIGQSTPFLLFFAPVIFTAWWAGIRPALLVTILSTVLITYFLLEPAYTFSDKEAGDGVALLLFVGESLLFAGLITALSNTQRRVARANAEILAASQRLAFLADASAILNRSLDLGVVLPELVNRSVPELADWCALDLTIDAPHQYASGSRPPQQAAMRDAGSDDDSAARLVIPITIRGTQIGMLRLESNLPAYGAHERAMMEEVARRIATAVENTQLYQASNAMNSRLEERVEERTQELQQALSELRISNDRLAVSNRELEQFASVASHDLQEPLRKIQAFGDRLKTKAGADLRPDALDSLERMQNAAARMQTLINDLLAFSRVTSKAQPFTGVDLNQIAREVLSDLETRIEQTGAQVHVGILPTIVADPLQMRQLLQNLISNALKFRRPGVAPVIEILAEPVSAEQAAGGRDFYRLLVRDNGIGFDEKYLDRIFNVFQRLHGRNVYEGTGVGLAICRKIVERHGGTITATSAPDQGATFIVMLPAIPDPVADEIGGKVAA